ncbi:unnamed protein product [Prorocentrum cordatum]|uniref:Uncharacterized protein n=1 Tax=Prorocentrum cordatum TaxID=2364126 RepID=A0ABN9X8A9_9DINO|nr:unnamed protein product [Polarella glacialis]|mmetsp:Transcript_97060/g.252844  ORF Transcript_97060/g.252844 Transcript_97060/m.252844 type:complete len:134 (-) Transcript_97060:33-434(-)
MARGLVAALLAFALVHASALASTAELEADRPKGARRRARQRSLAAETAAEVAKAGCANLGGEKWFSDPRGTLFQVKQDHCMISFLLKNQRGVEFTKRGIVKGTKVFVEPPFPEGQVVDGSVAFDNGARWERKW